MTQLLSREGKKVPSVTLKYRENGEWGQITTNELFGKRTVVVFSLPGAFTPTCSSTHLPRYNELAPVFKQNGVDEVVCISVNDPFVMEEWAKNQECDNVRVLPDGNGEFTEKMGMLVDKSDLNFGKRSWRYSMLVKDGTIEGCSFCATAKKDLRDAGITFAEVNLPHTIRTRALGAIAKAGTVPQMFVNGELIGSSDKVKEWLAARK